jgi:mono/diheme cytochrome c family protein
MLLACPSMSGAAQRGELLYETHCITCHSAKMHWRDQRVVQDWPGLKAEVRRWQGAVSLAWNEDDIAEVARYLNQTVYHLETPTPPLPSPGPAEGRPGALAQR